VAATCLYVHFNWLNCAAHFLFKQYLQSMCQECAGKKRRVTLYGMKHATKHQACFSLETETLSLIALFDRNGSYLVCLLWETRTAGIYDFFKKVSISIYDKLWAFSLSLIHSFIKLVSSLSTDTCTCSCLFTPVNQLRGVEVILL
jgi:hypothetical protein